mmetsp:Transcript_46162/g.142306  ORF Transcript_46162/g.142306 Transcript_46162/m.142306 type:complete len:271 (-) Transcript_46162:1260-2072(-)
MSGGRWPVGAAGEPSGDFGWRSMPLSRLSPSGCPAAAAGRCERTVLDMRRGCADGVTLRRGVLVCRRMASRTRVSYSSRCSSSSCAAHPVPAVPRRCRKALLMRTEWRAGAAGAADDRGVAARGLTSEVGRRSVDAVADLLAVRVPAAGPMPGPGRGVVRRPCDAVPFSGAGFVSLRVSCWSGAAEAGSACLVRGASKGTFEGLIVSSCCSGIPARTLLRFNGATPDPARTLVGGLSGACEFTLGISRAWVDRGVCPRFALEERLSFECS